MNSGALAFIFREQGSGTRIQVEAAMLAVGVVPDVVLTLPTGEGVVRAVEPGVGVAIVSRLIVDAPIRDARVITVPLSDLKFERKLRFVRLRRQTLSPAISIYGNITSTEQVQLATCRRRRQKPGAMSGLFLYVSNFVY